MRYRSDIDGLRALAVLPVVLFHAKLGPFSGGFVGVDVFFVISGYLITGVILGDMRDGVYSIVTFYERRIRRIIPMMVATVAATLTAAAVLFLPHDFREVGETGAAALLFSSNIFFLLTSGYFERAAELNPLLHTWSLAVEEQFYVVFPLILYALHKFAPRRALAGVVTIGVVSFAASIWMTAVYPTFAFYMLPTRAWELMLGSALSFGVALPGSAPVRNAMSVLGVALIMAAVLTYSNETPFPGWAAAVPCLGAALIIYAGGEEPSWAGRVLSLRPLVWFGLISYSLYLWHWPVLVFLRYVAMREPGTLTVIVAMLGTVLLSAASWRYIEQPFRRRGHPFGRAAIFALAAASVFVTLSTAATVYRLDGVARRMPSSVLAIADTGADYAPYREHCLYWPHDEIVRGHLCDQTLGARPSGDPSFILWGDSHGDAISPMLSAVAARENVYGLDATFAGCPPGLGLTVAFSPDCALFNELVLRVLKERHIPTVVLAARWALYAEGSRYGFFEPGLPLSVEERRMSGAPALEAALDQTLSALSALHEHVIVVGPIPEIRYDVPSTLARQAFFHRTFPLGPSRSEFLDRQALVLPMLERLRQKYGFQLIRPDEVLCGRTCAVTGDGKPLYYDSHHLSTYGAHFLGAVLNGAIAPSLSRRSARRSGFIETQAGKAAEPPQSEQ
jgi:peptidoglycan/LPS O-acetylase OafA/YrhL